MIDGLAKVTYTLTMPTTSSVPSIYTYIDELIKEKAQEVSLSDEARAQMKSDLLPRLHKFILLKTMTELAKRSPQDLADFQNMVDKGKPLPEIQNYVSTKIPDFQAVLTSIFLEFRQIYLGKT